LGRGLAEKVLDDVRLIAARTKPAAAAGDHDRAHAVVTVELLERLGQLAVDLERQRVEPLGPVERERDDAAGVLESKRLGLRPLARCAHGASRYATAWISTSAPGSTSSATPISAIAG